MIRRTSALKEAVLRQGYYTSVGIEWRDQDCNISAIVKAAEAKMQEDKRCYYQKDVHNRRIREMNHQLEQLIVEKQDADAFLSVIASSFKGVYFVNLDTDEVRHIFIPEYFDEMLSASCQKFSQAILLYARNLVCPEYLPQFTRLCSYDSLEKLLDADNVPEITYRKTDGTCLKLQVFKFKKYRQGNPLGIPGGGPAGDRGLTRILRTDNKEIVLPSAEGDTISFCLFMPACFVLRLTVPRKKREQIQAADTDYAVDDPAEPGAGAKDPGYQIEVKKSNQAPVDGPDQADGQGGVVERFISHSHYLLLYTPKVCAKKRQTIQIP